jgi:dihydroxyacetone kinase
MRSADEVVLEMVERVGCIGKYEDDQKVSPGDRVVILLNNLGSITQLEMGIIVSSTIKAVTHTLGARIERFYSGMFLSSLDMKGFSISLLRIKQGAEGDEVLRALDAPTDAPGWPHCTVQAPIPQKDFVVPLRTVSATRDETVDRKKYMDTVYRVIVSACDSIIACSDLLNELDAAIGDGDCGDTYLIGATKVKESDSVKNAPTLSKALLEISNIAGEDMGGSSGALLKIFFLAFSSALHEDADVLSLKDISTGLQRGCEKMSYYGGAVLGDSTMLDALIPLSKAVQQAASTDGGLATSQEALEAAQSGAESTKRLVAKAGRASYVPENAQKDVTDPGSQAVVAIMRGIHDELRK